MGASKSPKFGEIYMMQFDGIANEQKGWRPGLIIQNNVGNGNSPNIIAVPLTSAIKKVSQPTHVILKAEDSGLLYDSMVLCENPSCMSKRRLGKFVARLSDKYMEQVAVATLLASPMIVCVRPELLSDVQNMAKHLNIA